MTRLPVLSAREVIKGLNTQGFQIVSQKGSHIKMKKQTLKETRVVIIPDYNEIPVGTLKSIIRQSGLTHEEFIKLF
jgi:predicted RNA binding protein YcfA (HicA-like mRNA interferase family)